MPQVTDPIFNRDSLKAQLERARFERAMDVAQSLAEHRALLTTTEAARLNTILTGRAPTDDPWRQGPASLKLRSGREVQFAVMADPIIHLREKLHQATEMAESGNALEAIVMLFSNMVLSHYFSDANRRTAAIAAHYFAARYGLQLSGLALHEMGLGDLREEGRIDALRAALEGMLRVSR
ncbi:MAG: hypothetical protein ACK5QT_04130 [Oligoflexia bacterium]|jgi:hypothetical protein